MEDKTNSCSEDQKDSGKSKDNSNVKIVEGDEVNKNEKAKECNNSVIIIEDDDDDISRDEKPKNCNGKRDGQLLKQQQAPKRMKSSYICFYMAKQDEIKILLGRGATIKDVSKRCSELWKRLPMKEKAYWEFIATTDGKYNAPKRPVSAFLYFAEEKREQLRKVNPTMKSTQLSKLLGDMWRRSSQREKKVYQDREAHQREHYRIAIAQYRGNEANHSVTQPQHYPPPFLYYPYPHYYPPQPHLSPDCHAYKSNDSLPNPQYYHPYPPQPLYAYYPQQPPYGLTLPPHVTPPNTTLDSSSSSKQPPDEK